MGTKEFFDAKERALASLDKACTEKQVDEGILPILSLINNKEGFYTSSSCAGRIILLQIPQIGNKRGAEFLGIWHRTIQPEEVTEAAIKATEGFLWILAQAPILHIGVSSPELADALVKTAVSCGFKNSAIKSTGKKNNVELCSTERLDAPIGRDGKIYCEKEYLTLLIDISNEVIQRSQQKLTRFENILKSTTFLEKI
jgi:tRNA wybutosine-synthesizing protein 3